MSKRKPASQTTEAWTLWGSMEATPTFRGILANFTADTKEEVQRNLAKQPDIYCDPGVSVVKVRMEVVDEAEEER